MLLLRDAASLSQQILGRIEVSLAFVKQGFVVDLTIRPGRLYGPRRQCSRPLESLIRVPPRLLRKYALRELTSSWGSRGGEGSLQSLFGA